MKKYITIVFVLLCCTINLSAQNIWKDISIEDNDFLGVGTDGCIYVYSSYGIVYRSQDEGATWESVLDQNNGNFFTYNFTINKDNRVFIFENGSQTVLYSDDDGDIWQQTTPIPINTIWVLGLYSPSNDILLGWTYTEIFWTTDSGATWDFATLSFINEETAHINCVIVNDEGDIYASVYDTDYNNRGIYHSTLSDMQNWTLSAFMSWDITYMTFDPEGNVVANYNGNTTTDNLHVPGYYLIKNREIAVSDNGIIYKLKYEPDGQVRLNYSINHSMSFFDIGETMPVTHIPYPGSDDANLFKGNDNHLYYCGGGVFYKSIKNADHIPWINGVLAHVTAPYFTNNANDSRVAIVSDDETYYITVDGYWANPNSDSLIVCYDTIPVGTNIHLTGMINERLDDNGDTFKVVDIQCLEGSYYNAITTFIEPWGVPVAYPGPETVDAAMIQYRQPPYELYYLSINGELQTEYPIVFNGVEINGFCRFIGHGTTWYDYYGEPFNVFELHDVVPYYQGDFNDDGILTTENPLNSLALQNASGIIYLTHNNKMFQNYIDNNLYEEGINVHVKGWNAYRYDEYGNMYQTVDFVSMQTDEEITLQGYVGSAAMPHTGYIPIPGMSPAFVYLDKSYYIDNQIEQTINGIEHIIVGNDTIHEGDHIEATFTSRVLIDTDLNLYYRIMINEANIIMNSIYDTETKEFSVFPNPADDYIMISVDQPKDFTISDIFGKIVLTGTISSDNQQIDISELSCGMYFIKIDDILVKLIINR